MFPGRSRNRASVVALIASTAMGAGCGSSDGGGVGGSAGRTSGGSSSGGVGGSGAVVSSGGVSESGGAGGTSAGMDGASGGSLSTGGSLAEGGSEGGTVSGSGGSASRGGSVAAGGSVSTGGSAGSSSKGGATSGGAATGGAVATGGAAAGGPCVDFAQPVALGKAEPPLLSTLSGLVASRTQPGVLYANADRSGARFYALTKAGHTLADFTLTGLTATDWEDVAIGPGPAAGSYLYFGDVGDNAARPGAGAGRAEIQVIRLPEPTVSLTQAATQQNVTGWQRLRFTYPDRPHDCESLLVDPKTGELFIFTREGDGSAVLFQAPASTAPDTPTVLTRLVALQVGGLGANAGDISPEGDRALIRTYEEALLFVRAPGATWAATFATTPHKLLVANEAQSEGATFGADGRSWLSSGEVDPTIYEGRANCP